MCNLYNLAFVGALQEVDEMSAFGEWDGYVEDLEGRKWPCFGRFSTKEEYEAAKEGWKAALEWVLKKTDENYYVFDSKFDVYNLIKGELESLNNQTDNSTD